MSTEPKRELGIMSRVIDELKELAADTKFRFNAKNYFRKRIEELRAKVKEAVESSLDSTLQMLQYKNIFINERFFNREKTILHLAARNGNHDLLHVLINEFSGNSNQKDADGQTPIYSLFEGASNKNIKTGFKNFKKTLGLLFEKMTIDDIHNIRDKKDRNIVDYIDELAVLSIRFDEDLVQVSSKSKKRFEKLKKYFENLLDKKFENLRYKKVKPKKKPAPKKTSITPEFKVKLKEKFLELKKNRKEKFNKMLKKIRKRFKKKEGPAIKGGDPTQPLTES